MPPLEPYPQPEILRVTAENLPHALERIRFESKVLALDTETTGLDPRVHEIRLIQIAVTCASDPVFVFDLFALGEEAIQPLLDLLMEHEGPPICMHNAQFDCGHLWFLGCELPAHRVRCTMMQERILTAGIQEPRGKGKGSPASVEFIDVIDGGENPKFVSAPVSLEASVARRLKLQLSKEDQRSDWGAPNLSQSQLLYAATDPAATRSVYRIQESLFRFDPGLQRTAALENRLVMAVTWMGLNGLPVDRDRCEQLRDELEAEHAPLQAGFLQVLDQSLAEAGQRRLPRDLFGEIDVAAVNLRHSPTLLGWFNLLGFNLQSLDKNELVMAGIDHPAMGAFTAWRKAESLTRYVRAFIEAIADDGRIYASFQQYGSNTGRMACTKPNLLNIPRSKKFRQMIAAKEGHVLIGADYSQIEVRGAAVVSGDEGLLEVYRQGLDVYVATAAKMANIPLKEVTPDQRQKAKAAALGLLYGLGAKKFKDYCLAGYGIRLTEAEAVEQRNAFFTAYPGIAKYHDRVTEELREVGERQQTHYDSRTALGRRRLMRPNERNAALNHPVQGGCADVMKRALADLPGALLDAGLPETILISAIHDEILLESTKAEAERAAKVLEQVMADAARPLLGDIPAGAVAVIGTDWSQLK
jgi:DNA polymerase-1